MLVTNVTAYVLKLTEDGEAERSLAAVTVTEEQSKHDLQRHAERLSEMTISQLERTVQENDQADHS